MEDISKFYQDFMAQAQEDAELNEVTLEDALTENIIEYIKESNETNSPEILCIHPLDDTVKKRDNFRINAFDYSDMSGELDIFVTVFKKSDKPENIPHNEIDAAVSQGVRFFNMTIAGVLSRMFREARPDFAEVTDMILEEYKAKNIHLIRFFVITNGKLKVEYTLDDNKLTDQQIDCEYHVWDIENVQRADLAGRQMSEIDITLDNPIECIRLNDPNDKVNTYLGIISAYELGTIYSKHKDKLLDQNVRNYLGGKIKVNAKIARTLREAPEMFFSYNNGISSTASEVVIKKSEFVDNPDAAKMYITGLRNWHIVNGGQTTCTIFNAFKKGVDIKPAYLTVKVSEIRDKDRNATIVQNIAESANSQTQIKDSDLSANHKYLSSIDFISKKEWTPSGSVRPNTLWYFERLRGQLLSDKLNEGDARSVKVAKFMQARPKEQILTKTDIAKVLMAWDGFPNEASKGNEVCFNNFWKKDYKDTEVTKEYFHEIVAKRIIYLTIHRLFKEAGHSGYANIVDNYVLATVAQKTQQNLDLEYIWANQKVQPELVDPIKECIEVMVAYITKIAQEGINPTVVAKRADFCSTIKIQMANVKFPANLSLVKKNEEELTPDQQAAIDAVVSIPVEVWAKLSAWGKETHKMSIMEKKRIDHIVVALGKNPKSISYSSAEGCLKIMRMSEDAGFTR